MRKQWIRLALSFVLSLYLTIAASPVFAAETNMLQRHDTVVPASQTVENVVVIGGDAIIQGTVRDSVVVIDGNLDILRTAHIKGAVLVMGGKITQEPGAQVTDNVLNITFDQPLWNSLLIGGAMLIGLWFVRLLASLALMLAPVLLFFIVGRKMDSFESLLERSVWRLMTVGFVSGIVMLAVSILLSITVIGIPLAIVLVLLVLLAFLTGLTAISKTIGRWIPGTQERPLWMLVFGGALILTAAFNVPLFGGILLLFLFWISLGMATLWLWDKRKGT